MDHPKSTVVLLGQSLRATNSDRSIQEQLSDDSNQINVFAIDVDHFLGDDEQEIQRYAGAHQTLFEVPTLMDWHAGRSQQHPPAPGYH